MAKQLHPAPLILPGRESAEVTCLPHAQDCLSSSLAALQTATSLNINCCANSCAMLCHTQGSAAGGRQWLAANLQLVMPYWHNKPIPHMMHDN